jgi:hypothetical protein
MSLRTVADTMDTSLDVCFLLHIIRPILTFPGYPMPNDEVHHLRSLEILITDHFQDRNGSRRYEAPLYDADHRRSTASCTYWT